MLRAERRGSVAGWVGSVPSAYAEAELTVVVHGMRCFVDDLGRTLDSKAGPFLRGRAIYVFLSVLRETTTYEHMESWLASLALGPSQIRLTSKVIHEMGSS